LEVWFRIASAALRRLFALSSVGIDKLERDSQVLQASSEVLCSTLFTRSLGKAFGEENKKHRGCKYDKTGLLHVFR
jgi:hypothetical protein